MPLSATSDRRLTRDRRRSPASRISEAHVFKAGVEAAAAAPRRADFGFAVTDADAGGEAGLSEAALAFTA